VWKFIDDIVEEFISAYWINVCLFKPFLDQIESRESPFLLYVRCACDPIRSISGATIIEFRDTIDAFYPHK
jgi:hypothetical protein